MSDQPSQTACVVYWICAAVLGLALMLTGTILAGRDNPRTYEQWRAVMDAARR